ncbi:MAG: hypothetical protein IJ802_01010, partial [Kiritimatiellae bacterium]|nr:hypothetical protein [Kiritimatiellia bacterium]
MVRYNNLWAYAVAAGVAAAWCARVVAATTLDSDAMRAKKGALVLQTGSDWCVSGERVRTTFEGAFKRTKTGSQFVTGVWDDMDSPTAAVNAKNEAVKPLLIRTKRFPAITCFS